MYESHFGLSGPPFQLNPDPTFYFGSRGHSNALAYLKFGVHQGEGFIVVTGEVGAGKTTLVRALLAGLDPSKVVAAQVVNTQLQSGELLQSILAAFGVSPLGTSKATHIATLEGFLTALAAKGRRALLVVDEAQNLNQEAIEELRMLSNFQLGNHALLQSFLVGQPELRQQLESPAMEQLRQRVIASCHLGPLDVEETRAYVEHRLKHVGWSGKPAFADEAFERLHAWTHGIPRRINLLCNRILLTVFLNGVELIDAELVEETGADLHHETGSRRSARYPVASEVEAEASRAADATELQGNVPAEHGEFAGVERVGQLELPASKGVILCVAEDSHAWARLHVLGRAMSTLA
jgi:putative secretion ATPase (PEP-CTERM system associated)